MDRKSSSNADQMLWVTVWPSAREPTKNDKRLCQPQKHFLSINQSEMNISDRALTDQIWLLGTFLKTLNQIFQFLFPAASLFIHPHSETYIHFTRLKCTPPSTLPIFVLPSFLPAGISKWNVFTEKTGRGREGGRGYQGRGEWGLF